MSHLRARRRAGLLIPLFSCPTRASWGIGDIHDVGVVSGWLASAGQRVLQLLPLNEMAPGQQSPYSAITAMAIDPIYIHMPAVPDFQALGGEQALDNADYARLGAVRGAPRVDYAVIRDLKTRALEASFQRFLNAEWKTNSARARELLAYCAEEAWWLDDYALFRAIGQRHDGGSWTKWPDPLRTRDPEALARARTELADDILRFQYFQWLAHRQWRRAKATANAAGVALFGDLPFMVDAESADVWVHQSCFRFDATLGVPPDAFSDTGQDWGMPVYRWDVMADHDFAWLRARARRCAQLFDGYRVDHLVGFYRTYSRPIDGSPAAFTPDSEPAQIALGERILEIFTGSGAEIIAEDLGLVPDFVRLSMARMDVPGFRVARWEREWLLDTKPFKDPVTYPARSVATSGTHDTATLAEWWDEASPDEREGIARVPTIRQMTPGVDLTQASYMPTVRDALLQSLFASGSDLLLLPIQDVFGWRDRINVPATVTDGNWTYRLPWPADELDSIEVARERRDQLRRWSVSANR